MKDKEIPGWYIWKEWNKGFKIRAIRAGYSSTQQFILRIIEDVICGNIRYENKDLIKGGDNEN